MTPEQFVIALSNIITPAKDTLVMHTVQPEHNLFTVTSLMADTKTVKDIASICITRDVITLKHNDETTILSTGFSYSKIFNLFVILYLAQNGEKYDFLDHNFYYIDQNTGERRVDLWNMYIRFKVESNKTLQLKFSNVLRFINCIDKKYFKKCKTKGWIKRYFLIYN